MIVYQQNINFNKQCKYVYVQANDEPTHNNTYEACSSDCIY